MENTKSLKTLKKLIKSKIVKLNYDIDADAAANLILPLLEKFPITKDAMVYYLILITDHGLLPDLLNDFSVGFLLIDVQVLPLKFVLQVLSKLDVDSQILNIIRFGAVGISSRVLELLDSKYTSSWEQRYNLAEAIIQKVTNLIKAGNGEVADKIYYYFKDNISNISKSAVYILTDAKSTEIVRECGSIINKFLSLTQNIMSGENFTNVENDGRLYKLAEEYYEGNEIGGVSHDNIVCFLLEKLKEILMEVSCDVWIMFEDDLVGSSNLQQIIGNKIACILSNEEYYINESVKQCLTHFSIQPITEESLLINANVKKIMMAILSDECTNKETWYANLIERSESWEDVETIQFILFHIHLAEDDYQVMRTCLKYLSDSGHNCEIKNNFLSTYATLNLDSQLKVMEEIVSNGNLPIFEETEKDQNEIIEPFNRISSESSAEEILRNTTVLALKFPKVVLTELFHLASSSIKNHDLCLILLKSWKPLFFNGEKSSVKETMLYSVLLDTLLVYSNKKQQNLNSFLVSFASDHKDIESLLIREECKILEICLCKENWDAAKIAISSLQTLINHRKQNAYLNTLLAFLTQVALNTGWDVWSFNKVKAGIHEICSEIVSDILNDDTFTPDAALLVHFVHNLPEPVRSHFGKVWKLIGLPYPSCHSLHIRLLLQIRLANDEVHPSISTTSPTSIQILDSLIKILPVIHSKEWIPLFKVCQSFFQDNRLCSTFQVFSKALVILAVIATSDMIPCFEHCMMGFAELFNAIHKDDLSFDTNYLTFKLLLIPINRLSSFDCKDSIYYLILPALVSAVKMHIDKKDILLCLVDSKWRGKMNSLLNNITGE